MNEAWTVDRLTRTAEVAQLVPYLPNNSNFSRLAPISRARVHEELDYGSSTAPFTPRYQ